MTQAPTLLSGARDRDLVALAGQGDRAAFGELVRRNAPMVRDFLHRMGAKPDLVEDVTQDAMVAALTGLGGFRGDAAFSTWTVRIAARIYLRRVRRSARAVLMAEPLDLAEPDTGAETRSQQLLDLDRAMARLSAPERLCVALCHGAGLTHEEIAASIDAPLGTVKSHVLRGMKKLRTMMVEGEGG